MRRCYWRSTLGAVRRCVIHSPIAGSLCIVIIASSIVVFLY